MFKKYRELQCVCSHSPGYVSMFLPAGEILFRSTNRQTFCSEVINHRNRAPSPLPKRQWRQGRVSNTTCRTSEEKQSCVQAQKTRSGGIPEPFQSLVECLPGLTHITATTELQAAETVFSLHECAGSNTELRSSSAPDTYFTEGQFQLCEMVQHLLSCPGQLAVESYCKLGQQKGHRAGHRH